jgi:hypothetical protein
LKKVLSILLLVLFLFNVGGYYFVFSVLQYQSDKHVTSLLDAGIYAKEDAVEIKIPLSLPYPSLIESTYERVDGQFEYKGEYFSIVKQKVENDTAYVVCVRNHEAKRIMTTMSDYAKQANDLPSGASKKAMSFVSKILKEYSSGFEISIDPSTGSQDILSNSFYSENLVSGVTRIISPPPKA